MSAEVSKPLNDTLKQYDPDSTSPVDIAIVSGWDGAMEEVGERETATSLIHLHYAKLYYTIYSSLKCCNI